MSIPEAAQKGRKMRDEREGARVIMQSPSTTPLLSRSNGSAYEQKTSSSPSTPSSSATPVNQQEEESVFVLFTWE